MRNSFQFSFLAVFLLQQIFVTADGPVTCCFENAIEYQCTSGFSCCSCFQCCSGTEFCAYGSCISFFLVIFAPLAIIFFIAAVVVNIKMINLEKQYKIDLAKLDDPNKNEDTQQQIISAQLERIESINSENEEEEEEEEEEFSDGKVEEVRQIKDIIEDVDNEDDSDESCFQQGTEIYLDNETISNNNFMNQLKQPLLFFDDKDGTQKYQEQKIKFPIQDQTLQILKKNE